MNLLLGKRPNFRGEPLNFGSVYSLVLVESFVGLGYTKGILWTNFIGCFTKWSHRGWTKFALWISFVSPGIYPDIPSPLNLRFCQQRCQYFWHMVDNSKFYATFFLLRTHLTQHPGFCLSFILFSLDILVRKLKGRGVRKIAQHCSLGNFQNRDIPNDHRAYPQIMRKCTFHWGC